jgi:hypothetical protein
MMSNKTIDIDRHVPLPKGETRNIPLYPWLTMKVGDSFVVVGKISASAARGSFRRYQKLGQIPENLKAIQRTMDDEGPGHVRLWLVEK